MHWHDLTCDDLKFAFITKSQGAALY